MRSCGIGTTDNLKSIVSIQPIYNNGYWVACHVNINLSITLLLFHSIIIQNDITILKNLINADICQTPSQDPQKHVFGCYGGLWNGLG